MPTAQLDDTFTINAEYLHVHIGRRAAVPFTGAGSVAIPIVPAAVRLEPETGMIVVEADVPILEQCIEMSLYPDQPVCIQHRRAGQ